MAGEGLPRGRHQRIQSGALDGADVGAVASRRESEAGPHRPAIDHQGAGSADTMLADDVRAGQQQVLAQEVGEVRARLDLGLARRR